MSASARLRTSPCARSPKLLGLPRVSSVTRPQGLRVLIHQGLTVRAFLDLQGLKVVLGGRFRINGDDALAGK